jgi:hypothetical protein
MGFILLFFGLFNKIIAYVNNERLNLSTLTLALTSVVTHFFQLSNPFMKITFWPFHVNMHNYNSWFFLIGFFSHNTSNDKHKKKSPYQYGQINLNLLA